MHGTITQSQGFQGEIALGAAPVENNNSKTPSIFSWKRIAVVGSLLAAVCLAGYSGRATAANEVPHFTPPEAWACNRVFYQGGFGLLGDADQEYLEANGWKSFIDINKRLPSSDHSNNAFVTNIFTSTNDLGPGDEIVLIYPHVSEYYDLSEENVQNLVSAVNRGVTLTFLIEAADDAVGYPNNPSVNLFFSRFPIQLRNDDSTGHVSFPPEDRLPNNNNSSVSGYIRKGFPPYQGYAISFSTANIIVGDNGHSVFQTSDDLTLVGDEVSGRGTYRLAGSLITVIFSDLVFDEGVPNDPYDYDPRTQAGVEEYIARVFSCQTNDGRTEPTPRPKPTATQKPTSTPTSKPGNPNQNIYLPVIENKR